MISPTIRDGLLSVAVGNKKTSTINEHEHEHEKCRTGDPDMVQDRLSTSTRRLESREGVPFRWGIATALRASQ